MRVVYRQEDGTVAIIAPSLTEINPATGNIWTIEEIAAKDVPTGLKYKIIEDSDVPTDRSFRNSWTVDESDLTDGVGE
jgi:hypothetical protein|nr:hypothetical protein [uncultured Mediterranean phage uvMED]BAR26488.1 hypothetical protein [uncultured Mediterranean phage uvMED]